MTYASLLSLVRQYRSLSDRTRKSYAVQVDFLSQKYIDESGMQGAARDTLQAATSDMLAREYPAVLRSYPQA